MNLISSLPLELRQETVKYCYDFSCVLHETNLFYISSSDVISSLYLASFAARKGYLSLLKWIRRGGTKYLYPWDSSTCAFAAKAGHLEILKWLRENECPWDIRTCRWAAEAKQLHVLQWLRENECPCDGLGLVCHSRKRIGTEF